MNSVKRAIRTFVIGLVCYMAIFSLFSFETYATYLAPIKKWFWVIFGCDLVLLALQIGREKIYNMLWGDDTPRITEPVTVQVPALPVPGPVPALPAPGPVPVLPESQPVHVPAPARVPELVSQPASQSTSAVLQPPSGSPDPDSDDESELDIDLLSDDEEPAPVQKTVPVPEPQPAPAPAQTETVPVPSPESQRLTQENLERYQANKSKIQVDPSVKSQDLNL